MKHSQKHIQRLYEENTREGRLRSIVASFLQSTIATTLNGSFKLINEFIQNADDASASSVSFSLVDDLFIISHDGRPFDADDVERVCHYANQDFSSKQADIEKTGHKGIGFKSIFSMTDCIHVISGEYSFRFDKSAHDHASHIPWQIIPIWTDTQDISDVEYIFLETQTHFLISVKDKTLIETALNELLNRHDMLLFLRNIQTIQVLGIEIVKHQQSNRVDIIKNDELASQWLLRFFSSPLPSTVQQFLAACDDYACPKKLKEAETVEITFAARIENADLCTNEGSYLACGLPTEEMIGLPFHVNAQFLLNAERTRLLRENHYNEFLLGIIAQEQIQWLAELSEQANLMPSMLSLLGPRLIDTSDKRQQAAYRKFFDAAIKQYPCIPCTDTQLRVIEGSDICHDPYDFFSRLCEISGIIIPKIINPQIKHADKLYRYGVKAYSKQDIIKHLDFYAKSAESIESNIAYLLLLRDLQLDEVLLQSGSAVDAIRTKKIILNRSGVLSSADKLIFSTEIPDQLVDILGIQYVHPALLENTEVRNYLAVLQVHNATRIAVIRAFVFDLGQRWMQLTPEQNIMLVRYLFDAYQNDEFQEDDFQSLRKILLITKGGRFLQSRFCCLADEYLHEGSIEALFTRQDEDLPVADFFVSPCYLAPMDSADEQSQWKTFLNSIGVISAIGIIAEKIRVADLDSMGERIHFVKEYLQFLRQNDYLGYRRSILSSGDTLTFSSINYLSYINYCPRYRELFFLEFVSKWDDIKPRINLYSPYTRSLPEEAQYFTYVLRHHVPFLRNRYWSKLGDIFGQLTNVLRLPVELTQQQAKYIGLKTTLDTKEALRLMSIYQQTSADIVAKRKFISALKMIVNNNNTDGEKRLVQRWAKEGCLIAADNTFQPISSLGYLPLSDDEEQVSAPCLVKNYYDFNQAQMQTLISLFNLRAIKRVFISEQSVQLADKDDNIKQHVIDALPAIVIYQCQKINGNLTEIWSSSIKKLQILQIYTTSVVTVVDSSGGFTFSKPLHYEDQNLYCCSTISERQLAKILAFWMQSYLELDKKSAELLQELIRAGNNSDEREKIILEELSELSVTEGRYRELLQQLHEVSISSSEGDEADNITSGSSIPYDKVSCDRYSSRYPSGVSPIQQYGHFAAWGSVSKTAQSQHRQPLESPPLPSAGTLDISHCCDLPRTTNPSVPAIGNNGSLDGRTSHLEDLNRLLQADTQNLHGSRGQVSHSTGSVQSHRDHQRTGWLGECYVFESLYEQFKTTLSDAVMTEHNQGVTIAIDNHQIDILWYNKVVKPSSSTSSVDIDIQLNGKTYFYIEVKSTSAGMKEPFFISPNEWVLMRDMAKQYMLAQVSGVGSNSVKIGLLKNPFDMIMKGWITLAKQGRFKLSVPIQANLKAHLCTVNDIVQMCMGRLYRVDNDTNFAITSP